ncbi:hypothetical protein RASY3_08770 [Ruminococcus albus SY3]|uniref:Uncharacterized protein n=1 Tax=Ruminococcus albus SY3 TaxID=1341156 RepID=A0A011VY65_RUMAL|nr:hypothetical protein [Ruminococcus albus]EXM40246.1 hypothetical protein RASY3_08770 [Ruminococcus albus SY3]
MDKTKIKYLVIPIALLIVYCCFFRIRLYMLEDYPEKYIKENYPNAVVERTAETLDKKYRTHDYRPWYAIFPETHWEVYSDSQEMLAHSIMGRICGDVTDIYYCYDPETGTRFTEKFTVCGVIPKVRVEEPD